MSWSSTGITLTRAQCIFPLLSLFSLPPTPQPVMPYQHPYDNIVGLSPETAFAMCDGLLRVSHNLMIELPMAQLRDVRYLLDVMVSRADQLLDSAECDFSLNFNGLAIDPDATRPPWAEDFGAVLVSTTISTTSDETPSSTSARSRRQTISRANPPPITAGSTLPPIPTSAAARPPTPASTGPPTPAPSVADVPPPTPPMTHGRFPLVLSSRNNVGFPDYTHHPSFIQPGIPGTYQRPPTISGLANPTGYYVVTKGLYVGIFLDWEEVAPWVLGVSGAVYRRFRSWEEAKGTYNARLDVGAVKVLF